MSIKVLIVDDIEANRVLLRSIIEMYAEENNMIIEISEAVDGMEASMMALNEQYQIIFMDIMMPNMNGIEATKQIRQYNSKSLIIAVSAANDTTMTSEILSSGAEDYISKPINMDIFNSRFGNYLTLIESRKAKKPKESGAFNLFSNDIYNRFITFNINNDDGLAEFWEYYLFNNKFSTIQCNDTVRYIFDLANTQLQQHETLKVIVEESEQALYFTINVENFSLVHKSDELIQLTMKSKEDIISFKVNKTTDNSIFSSHSTISSSNIIIEPAQEVEITVFDYMEADDLEDIKGYITALNSLLLIVGNGIEEHEIEELAELIDRISKIATVYTQSYPIGHALAPMAREIRMHKNAFLKYASTLAPLCVSFSADMNQWIQLVFINGTERVDIMDQTITSNIDQFISYLNSTSPTVSTQKVDDIFDF